MRWSVSRDAGEAEGGSGGEERETHAAEAKVLGETIAERDRRKGKKKRLFFKSVRYQQTDW